jgi:Zn-finger nucleic acid-binding protein
MKCPNDQTTLVMSERQNIEIDYCPTCRGVWLDRGELDKLIERAQPPVTPPAPASQQHYELRDSRSNNDFNGDPYKKKKKESFLGDIFDF